MANDYATATEALNMLTNLDLTGLMTNGVSASTLFTALLTRASRAIDTYTSRKPGAYYVNADVIRYFTAPKSSGGRPDYFDNTSSGGYGQGAILMIDELAAAPTEIAMSLDGRLTYTALSSSDYILSPYNAADDGEPYNAVELDTINGTYGAWYTFPKGIKITGKFGYSATVPDDIKQATIIQAGRWFKRGQMAYQDVVSLAQGGEDAAYVDRLDTDLCNIVKHYRRQAI